MHVFKKADLSPFKTKSNLYLFPSPQSNQPQFFEVIVLLASSHWPFTTITCLLAFSGRLLDSSMEDDELVLFPLSASNTHARTHTYTHKHSCTHMSSVSQTVA